MTAVPFDTLKMSRKLETGGFTDVQASTFVEAVAEAMAGAEVATKADVQDVRNDLGMARAEHSAEIASVRKDLKTEIQSVRSELKADMELLRRDLTIRTGSMMIVAVGVILTAMRFMPV